MRHVLVASLIAFVGMGTSFGEDTLLLTLKEIPDWVKKSKWAQISEAQTEIQIGLFKQAQSVLFPQVAFSGSYMYSSYVQKLTQRMIVGFNPSTGMPIFQEIPIEFGKHHTYSITLGLQYPIWTWGRFRFLSNAQREQVRVSEISAQQTIQSLSYSAQQLYLSLLALQESQNLLDEIERTLKRHYKSTRDRYESGLASELDLMQAEVNWRNLLPQQVQLKSQFENLLNNLRNLIDLPDQPIKLVDTLETELPPLPDTSRLIEQLEARPDLIALDHQIQATEYLLKAAKTEDKPTITLQAGYTLRNPIGFEQKWGTMGTVSFGLTFPVFDGFRTKGKVLQLASTLQSLKILRKKTVEEAKRDIRSLINDLESLEAQIDARRYNLELAKKVLQTAEKQYEMGLISELEYMNAANGYLQAKTQYLQAIANYQIQMLELKKVVEVGGTSQVKANSMSSSNRVSEQQNPYGTTQGSTGWEQSNQR